MTVQPASPRLLGLAEAAIRVAPSRPGVRAMLWTQGAAGLAGGSIPTALLARTSGAGLGLGGSWGLTAGLYAALVTGPLILAAMTSRDRADSRELHLSGWPTSRRFAAEGLAALAWLVVGLAGASVGGALVGLGDAVRRGSSPLTAPGWPQAPGWLLLTVLVTTATLLAWGRSALASVGVGVGGVVAFFAVLPLTYGSLLRPVLALWPVAPAWAATYDGPSDRLSLSLSSGLRFAVVVGWLLMATGLAVRGLQTGLRSR